MRTAIFRLAAIFALVLGALVVGTAASAANTNPNGAQVINITNQCEPDSYTGGQFCTTEQLVLTNPDFSTNPAGITSVGAIGSACYTETDSTGAVVYQDCQYNIHEHLLLKDGAPQEAHFSYTETGTTPYGPYCVTYNFHYANGQVQFDNITSC